MAGKKTASTRTRKAPAKKAVVRNTDNVAIRGEIYSIIYIAISILALVSVFTPDSVGIIGRIVNAFLFGMLGIGAFVCPVLIIVLSIYSIASKKSVTQTYQMILGSAIVVLLLSLVHISGVNENEVYKGLGDYIKSNYLNGSVGNGGLIGAVFGNCLLTIFGRAGSYIVALTVMLASAVYITGRSFFGGVQNAYKEVKGRIDERASENDYDVEYYDEDEEDIYDEPVRPAPEKVRRIGKGRSQVDFVLDNGKKSKKNSRIMLPQDEFSRPRKITLDRGHIPDFVHADVDKECAVENQASAMSIININGIDEPEEYEEAEKNAVRTAYNNEYYEDDEQSINFSGNIEDDSTSGNASHSRAERSEKVELFNEQPRSRLTKKEAADIEKEEMVNRIAMEVGKEIIEPKPYEFPPESLLYKDTSTNKSGSKTQILETSKKLESTLKSFGVDAKVVEVSKGPTVTRYELSPGQGVKVSKISGLADDLALNLAANGIRIEAPIPGKAAVGIEVPNAEAQIVYFRDIVLDNEFKKFPSKLAFGLGKDIGGKTVVYDIGKMPHLLIAGATGAGKSVCINTLIGSILYKATPEEVKLIMIDPKVVELSVYNGIPHLLIPVVTDPKKASGALNWAVREMLRRYDMFAQTGVRDLKGYNSIAEKEGYPKEPQIVIIIDELADLMMAVPREVEDSICRLAQMARAAGLHLIIATQRPSVDVITGVIKANIPSRLAFSVSSGIDSRTILDMVGAEKLLGRGDMLFSPIGTNKPIRIQGAFISDKEVEAIVDFLKVDYELEYSQEMIDSITATGQEIEVSEDADEYFDQAVEFVIQKEKASASMLQRQFRIGYNRAARLVEDLETRGIIGPEDGSKPRKVLITQYMWEDMKRGGGSNESQYVEEQID